MPIITNQSAATSVATDQDQRRQRSVSSQPVQELNHPCDEYPYNQPQLQHGQHAYATNQQYEQPRYETDRAWARQNPEVLQVIHDPRLHQSLNASGSAANQTYPQAPYGYADPHGNRSQHTQTYGSGDQQLSRSGLTAQQLYTSDYGREPSNNMETWLKEEQRKGPWYGNVEQLKKAGADKT
ncbi:hypothetical protein E8E11_007167 [Didymella keratinophila]|nr:hypothetical protein E8E11_007167 [Didymella keratinophila]